MRSNETNIYEAYCKFNNRNNPIRITFNIKNVSLIPYCIHTVKCPLHISITGPLTILYNIHPYLQWQ